MNVFKSLVLLGATFALAACNDADVASRNLSQAADNFQIQRRVVFYNGITGDYILSIEGLCSIGGSSLAKTITVTCKTGASAFKKHFLGVSDNVTYFAEQLESANVSAYHYRVTFKPQVIIPDINFRGSAGELLSPTRPVTP
jgi:hypothetical protein